jgi:hypothetical protein
MRYQDFYDAEEPLCGECAAVIRRFLDTRENCQGSAREKWSIGAARRGRMTDSGRVWISRCRSGDRRSAPEGSATFLPGLDPLGRGNSPWAQTQDRPIVVVVKMEEDTTLGGNRAGLDIGYAF